jgi:hypothetical protein
MVRPSVSTACSQPAPFGCLLLAGSELSVGTVSCWCAVCAVSAVFVSGACCNERAIAMSHRKCTLLQSQCAIAYAGRAPCASPPDDCAIVSKLTVDPVYALPLKPLPGTKNFTTNRLSGLLNGHGQNTFSAVLCFGLWGYNLLEYTNGGSSASLG